MASKKFGNRSFFISVAAVFIITTVVICCSAFSGSGSIEFKRQYYFIYYSVRENAVSAAAISDAVHNYGGAGYVLEYENEFYVTIACYYSDKEAERIYGSLLRRGLNCSILEVKTEKYQLNSRISNTKKDLYAGNLNTLYSLSTLCYECANGLDTGEYGQSEAEQLIESVKKGLQGLNNANFDNCFTEPIKKIIATVDSCTDGYLYSSDIRNLQIAITDILINIKLY